MRTKLIPEGHKCNSIGYKTLYVGEKRDEKSIKGGRHQSVTKILAGYKLEHSRCFVAGQKQVLFVSFTKKKT